MINFWKEIQMEDSCTEIRIQTNTDNTGHVFLHSHTFYEILLCKSGNIQYLLGDSAFASNRGIFCSFRPESVTSRSFRSRLRNRIPDTSSGSTPPTGISSARSFRI